MTEGNDDGNYLVRVRAQVMMRDDSTGLWVPMGGGGLSNVSVRKRITQPDLDDSKHEYLIYGKRISDQTVVLSCTIKKDFEYYKVMPTFHHWKTGDMKFGLTFQTAADARAFDNGVRMAFDDLVEGLNDLPYRHGLDVEKVFVTVHLPPVEREVSRSSSGSVTTSSSRHTPTVTPIQTPDHPSHPSHYHHHHHHHHHHYPPPGGGSGVGGVVSVGGIGISTTNTSPSSTPPNLPTTTTGTTQPYPHPHPNHHHDYLHHITFLPRPKPPLPPNIKPPDKPIELECDHKPENPLDLPPDQDKTDGTGDPFSYVQFDQRENPRHHYSYPVVEGLKSEMRDTSSLKKPQSIELGSGTPQPMAPPVLPSKKPPRKDKKGKKARCKHCQEMFTYDANSRGSCNFAPDCVRSAIDTLTCITCAQCMLYHCMSDAEGDFAHHPCECGGPGGATDESCGRRWLGLTLLSLLVPCLWCYLPLRACHQCAVACGLCGGRHEAS